MYFVYIIKCADSSLYTGITTDLKRRFAQHQEGKGGHYTRAKGVVKIVYAEKHFNRSAALKREAEIKTWPRVRKLRVVKSRNKFGEL